MSFGEGATYEGNVFDKTVPQTLSLSQVVADSNTLLRTVELSLSLSDVASDVHQGRGDTTSTLSVTQSATLNHTWVIGVGQSIFIGYTLHNETSYDRSVNDTLSLTQVANVSIPLTVTQTLTLTDTNVVSYSTFVSTPLALTQTVSFSRTVTEHVNNILSLTGALVLSKSVGKPPANVLGISQHIALQLSHAEAASNTLTLTQEMYLNRTDENEPQALTLSQTATVQKIKNISVVQTLNFTQASYANGTPITLSVTDVLVFKQSHDRPTGIPSMPIVTIPSGYVVVVPDVSPLDTLCYPYRGTLTLLEIPGTSVILPTAEFNDSQSYNGQVTIKRAMNGHRRIYHRKMGIAQKLHYDFVIDRRKAIELRQFLIQANSVPIKLTNWKGEVWQVVITNSPLTFTEDSYWGPGSSASSGNKSSITLEFEGARIN